MPFSILYVCTGNICRSPLAERYTVRRLADTAADVAPHVVVGSAGVRALEGYPMDPPAAVELARRGGSGDGFVARRVTAADVAAADLVLTMTREHRALALEQTPVALRRAFTLLEAADLVGRVADVDGGPHELVATMAAGRSTARPDTYDVADPIGEDASVHAAVAATIVTAVDTVADALVPRLRR